MRHKVAQMGWQRADFSAVDANQFQRHRSVERRELAQLFHFRQNPAPLVKIESQSK